MKTKTQEFSLLCFFFFFLKFFFPPLLSHTIKMKNWDDEGERQPLARGGPRVGAVAVVTPPEHEIRIKTEGTRTTVPDNPCSHLAYYFHCINCLGEPFTDLFSELPSLLNYHSTSWSSQEEEVLFLLAGKLDPTVLLRTGVLMFAEPGAQILGGMSNTFVNVDVATKQNIAVASDELIAIVGREKVTKITKIMVCTKQWITSHWINPMEVLMRRRARSRPSPGRSYSSQPEEKSPILCHCCLCIFTACLWCPIWFCCGQNPGQCCYRPCGCGG